MNVSEQSERPDGGAIRAAQSSAAWTRYVGSGVVMMSGSDRLDLLHRLTTNDLTQVQSGRGMQTVLQTEKARIIDVITVLQDSNHALLLTSNNNAAGVVNWIRKYVIMEDVKVTDITSTLSRFDIVGPHSATVVQELTGEQVADFALYQWVSTGGDSPMHIVRLPGIVELGYAIIGSPDTIAAHSAILAEHGDTVQELDPSQVEYMRICTGMGKYGFELTDTYNPLEAGLLHLTSFTKGCYIGQEVIARLDSYNKVKQRLMGLRAPKLEVGWQVVDQDTVVGVVTSTTQTLLGNETLALAYVRQSHATDGASISVRTTNNETVTATIHLLPIKE